MKKLLFVLLLICAQEGYSNGIFSFGVMGGFNTAFNSFKKTGKIISTDDLLGYNANLFARIKVSQFIIQPELGYYNNRGSINYDYNSRKISADLSVGDLYTTALLGIVFSKIRILVGPVAYFTTNVHYGNVIKEISSIERHEDDATGKFGIQAGLGLDLSRRWCLDGRIQKVFTKSNYNITYNDNSSETLSGTLGSLSLSVGFAIIK